MNSVVNYNGFFYLLLIIFSVAIMNCNSKATNNNKLVNMHTIQDTVITLVTSNKHIYKNYYSNGILKKKELLKLVNLNNLLITDTLLDTVYYYNKSGWLEEKNVYPNIDTNYKFIFLEYYSNGVIKKEGIQGLKYLTGKMREYDSLGNLTTETISYENKSYNGETGSSVDSKAYILVKEYNKAKQVIAEKRYNNFWQYEVEKTPLGEWKFYNNNGKLVKTELYDDYGNLINTKWY